MSPTKKDESDHLSEDGDGVSEELDDEAEENTFFNNYQEFFKNRSFNPNVILAPPLDLIAKTGYTQDEPIQTGAPINFLKLEKLIGGKTRKEVISTVKTEPLKLEILGPVKPDIQAIRQASTQLLTYLQQMTEQGHVVYCRFGKDYVSRIAKEQQALINTPGLTAPMKQIATYLINIKKLMRDHNIDSESKDFERLSTMRPGRKRYETPPEPFYIPQSPED